MVSIKHRLTKDPYLIPALIRVNALPCKQTTCIPSWNDVETAEYTWYVYKAPYMKTKLLKKNPLKWITVQEIV